jgi:hypothetical protein
LKNRKEIEMITVAIMINANPIITRTAVNKGEVPSAPHITKYHVDDGSTVHHKRGDGPVVLAKKILDNVNYEHIAEETNENK